MPTILIIYSWLKGSLTYTKKEGRLQNRKGGGRWMGQLGMGEAKEGEWELWITRLQETNHQVLYLKGSRMPMLCRGPILTVITPIPVKTWALRGNHLVKWWITSAPFSFQWEWTWEQRALSLWLANATFSSPLGGTAESPSSSLSIGKQGLPAARPIPKRGHHLNGL